MSKFHEELKFIGQSGYDGFTMFECDTDIHISYDLKTIPKERHGSGGTSFRPVFRKAEEDNADLVIYFTDGEGEYPDLPSRIPTLWVLTQDYDIPFGRKVILK